MPDKPRPDLQELSASQPLTLAMFHALIPENKGGLLMLCPRCNGRAFVAMFVLEHDLVKLECARCHVGGVAIAVAPGEPIAPA